MTVEPKKRISEILPVGGPDPDPAFGARRRHRRWPLNAEIEMLKPIQTKGFTINASRGGLRVALEEAVASGTVWEARITTSHAFSYVEVGEIVWARNTSDGCIAGLTFESR